MIVYNTTPTLHVFELLKGSLKASPISIYTAPGQGICSEAYPKAAEDLTRHNEKHNEKYKGEEID